MFLLYIPSETLSNFGYLRKHTALYWRRATLPLDAVPSPLETLTAVFGMRTGVTPPVSSPEQKSVLYV